MALKLQEPVSVFAALHDGALLLLVLLKGAATAVDGVLEAVQLRLVHLGEVVDKDVEVLSIIVHTHIIASIATQRNSLETSSTRSGTSAEQPFLGLLRASDKRPQGSVAGAASASRVRDDP